jgi:hypothetical protein
MSLINDALQRAKQQTTQPTPPPGLPLRPVEVTTSPKKSSGLLLPITCASLVCVAGLLGLIAFGSNRSSKGISPMPVSAEVKPVTQALAPAPVERQLASKAADSTKPAGASNSPDAVQATNSISLAAESPALRPAPLKLQAILFSATKPSAMINGKTVYVGNRVGEFRVASITQSSATLVSDSATNVLSFQE